MKLEKKNVLVIIFFSLLVLLISILFNKSLNTMVKFLLSGLFILIGLGLFALYDKFSEDDKIKKEQKLKEEKERKKKEEYERLLKERKQHIEELKKDGLNKINIQSKLNTTNMATSINTYQGDKLMVTFFGGKLIIYSVDIVQYSFTELLYTKEFSFNTYNAIEMKENKNWICVCGYPCIKIIETCITNLSGKENNSFKVIQYLDCSKYNKEILRVIELTNDSLISISTDYLLIWNKNPEKKEYEINKDKVVNYTKYENLLILSNLLKIDEENIVVLKQSNSNLTKSSINFMEIKDPKSNEIPEDTKIIDLKITPLGSNTNNLCVLNEKDKTFCVGCINGVGIIYGINKELIQFVELENEIKNIDTYFDGSIIVFIKYEEKKDSEGCSYNFIQFKKEQNSENCNDFQYNGIVRKTSDKIDDGIKVMNSYKDGIIIIGDEKANLQLWH